ncbi:centromere/kinetochore protein zw10 homolog isoform X2 [Durio zibethinus]|uniref:Centromere/kinetochore protein zw10 homolog isoform X2 n=1 Tax=Durio zibethinus TaxID=66656 RepID=A0A6P5XK02_DURZI|nr:centromere/kinetochore protein zw10 homolog isoform X2 [Durio zibethinus]
MDPLFDRINVRDLLSGHDLSDPSTPLAPLDLRLESHSLQIKSKVRSYLLSHHDGFASLFSQCNDAILETNEISDNISCILSLISDHPIDVEIRELVDEIGRKTKEAREKRELLGLLRVIVGICKRLEGARSALSNGRLRFAAEEVKELKKALRIGDEEEVEPIVYGLLRKQWADLFDDMQELLVKFMENAVRFEPDSRTIRVKYRLSVDEIDGIELHTVLEAMDVAGILDYGFAKAADLIIKHVITPAANYRSLVTFVEDVNYGSDGITEAVLKILPSQDNKILDADGDAIYARVIQVIRFIFKHICFENGSWIHSFGRLTWPRISDLIISNFLSKIVPEDASRLADFQKIIKYTSEFEIALKEMMFISVSDNKDDRLSNFAENVEVHFAFRKKMEILGKARNLLLQCDFFVPQYTSKGPLLKKDGMAINSSKQVVDLLFSAERCVVSKAASQLMELVHQALQDVGLSSTRVALEFYHAARDAILLYEAIIPVKLEWQLDGINQVAILMHNDCLYLSQEILGLAFEYRTDFPNSIKEHAVFADMAPRFHLIAEEILQRQIQIVIFNLREAIDGADGFQNTHQMQQFESAKFSIDQVVFVLEKVHIIWEPLLQPSTYRRSMCMVLESVFSRITKDILLLDDLAAEETLQLQRLIHLMLENLSSLLKSLIAIDSKGKSEEDSGRPIDDDIIPSLRKIHKLAELLDMPLKSITISWESGELLSCGFTIVELKDFIRAIFADSPLRKECLWRIENASL